MQLNNKFASRDVLTLGFRSDINGLRAVAVLSVVFFHFHMGAPGGFVGVDVFFVISGFLMIQILVNRPGALDFYAKRMARIVPALTASILVTLLITGFLLLPAQYALTARQAFGSALFFVNFQFANSVGYFDPAAENSWFLHCWSLAVEIQFYLVFPIYLWGSRRLGFPVFRALLMLAVVSFAAACMHSGTKDSFYLPHYRLWEFAAGGMAALLPSSRSRLVSYVGVVLIAAAACFFDATYSGVWLAIPVLGAALVLWSATEIRPLSNHVMQSVGTISYSVYLWHWPVLMTARYFDVDKGWTNVAILCAVTFAIAAASQRWIEKPFRNTRFVSCGIAIAIMLLALNGSAPQQYIINSQVRAVTNDAVYDGPRWRARNCFLEADQTFVDLGQECLKKSGEKPQLLLWGDSIAAALYPGISSQTWTSMFDVLQVTASSCSVVGELAASNLSRCGGIREHMLKWIKQNIPPVVIITTATNTCTLGHETLLQALLATLKADGVSKVIVTGPGPIWNPPLPEAFYRQVILSRSMPIDMTPAGFDSLEQCDKSLRNAVEVHGGVFISLFNEMCHDGQCKVLLPTDKGLALSHMDSFHLARGGAYWVAFNLIGPALFHGN